jgi:hypothetical protein
MDWNDKEVPLKDMAGTYDGRERVPFIRFEFKKWCDDRLHNNHKKV